MALPGQKKEDDWQLLSLENWGSLNTKAPRASIEDGELSYIENFMPLGKRNLRSLYGEGAVLYTTSGVLTIIYRFNFVLSGTDYWAVFLSDGSAVQVNATSGATVTIGAASTFYTGGALPACSQFENKYLAIVSTLTINSYWIWDGANLYTAGTLAPDTTVTNSGKGYTSAPTITITGGSGTGATATATIKNQTVTQLNITNPGSGYALGDLPVATISGGGTDNQASGTAVIATTTGQVTSINILAGGTNYTTSSVITFSGGGGSGAAAVITGLSNGVITAVTVTHGGFGYSAPPTMSISVGTGAVLFAEISSGGIIGVTLTSGGTNYYGAPTVTIVGDGTGATAIANMNSASVVSVTVTAGGSSYTSAPTVAFSGGGGTGAAGYAIIQNGGGPVTYVVITDPGTGYTSAPTVSFSGGGGSGAAATAAIGPGLAEVQSVLITNPGQNYTKAAILFSGGNNSASVSISIFAFGFSGTTIETYQNRIWIANGTNIYGTAANTTTQFAASSGGIIFQSTDASLRQKITRLAQSSGSLYVFGDSSISSFSNVTVNANGSANYNYTNIDPQVGTPWTNSVAAFGRALVFANATGVYALFGGAAEKVSASLDGLFEVASFNTNGSGVTPTGAAAILFETKCYVFCFTTYVPYSGTNRTIEAIWDGQRWFLASQAHTTQFVATREVNSALTAWGDDGTHLYPMFTTPSDTLTKAFQTKLFGVQPTYVQSTRVYVLAQVSQTSQPTPNLSIGVDTELGLGTLVSNQQLGAVNVNVPSLYGYSAANYGRLMGLTCTTTVADVTIINEILLVRNYSTYG